MVLTVCIVNYNGGEFLPACIESVLESDLDSVPEIVVVDNRSTDGSMELIRKRFPGVRIIENERNTGFASANNRASDSAAGRFLLFLNPDTVVPPDGLRRMVSFLESRDGTAACGCRLIHPETGRVESSARSDPELLPLLWNLTYIDRLFPSSPFFARYLMTHAQELEERDADWVTGACLLVRSDVFEQVGGFDSSFFMYCEDIDLCYRIRRAGWRICYYPAVSIGHYRGLSSAQHRGAGEGELSIWGARQYAGSVLMFYAKHYGNMKTVLLRIVLTVTSLFKAAVWITVGSLTRGWLNGSSRARSYCAMMAPAFERIPPRTEGD